MDNFYTNHTIASPDTDAIAAAIDSLSRDAYLSPPHDQYTVVFDEQSDTQDPSAIISLGTYLSQQLNCPVLAILNHDDDILAYWLFKSGSLIDQYNSAPDYFGDEAREDPEETPSRGGNPTLLAQTFNIPSAIPAIQQILHDTDYLFALERHQALCEALHLPTTAVACGFNYIHSTTPDDLPLRPNLRKVP